MIAALATLAKQLVVAGARAAVGKVAELVSGQRDAKPENEPSHPSWKDVEHMRAQERASIEAGKKARK